MGITIATMNIYYFIGKELTGSIGAWGEFGETANCLNDHYICGVQIRQESNQDTEDDTGLNDIVFKCCA